eukprot:1237922-Prorocentrum_lima.AAC.1
MLTSQCSSQRQETPNQCSHRRQERTGSNRTCQVITCQDCQKTLMKLHQGVDSQLVDKCVEDACDYHIYSKPMTDSQFDLVEQELLDMERRMLFKQDMGSESDYDPDELFERNKEELPP